MMPMQVLESVASIDLWACVGLGEGRLDQISHVTHPPFCAWPELNQAKTASLPTTFSTVSFNTLGQHFY